jgi:hypothetical protein
MNSNTIVIKILSSLTAKSSLHTHLVSGKAQSFNEGFDAS